MNLSQVKDGAKIAFSMIGADRELSREIQGFLADAGLLDPPPDSRFGPVSQWALGQFLLKTGATDGYENVLTTNGVEALLAGNLGDVYPLFPGNDFAGRVVQSMRAHTHWINRHPQCLNIVYVDGTNMDGTRNSDNHNRFDDVRLLIRISKEGVPVLAGAWDGTTEPGDYYVKKKLLDPKGAAHIVAGQYKAWSMGLHNRSKPSAHEALVQTADIEVSRDLNQDQDPVGDKRYIGMYGINQHWGYDLPQDNVRDASAGCLVGRTKNGHREFIKQCKTDPRYLVNNSYRFMTTILRANALTP